MRPQDLIERKRDGHELTRQEISYLVQGYTREDIPNYQMAAFLMAAFLNGMSQGETIALLQEMLHSGVVLTHDDILLPKVDKHSTGGVGDKTSLVVAPVAAACGICVPMISGRALAHTGGTLDKLEAIPGFRTDLSLDEFKTVLHKCGMSLIGQTHEIAPADRRIYALRDLTATVPFAPFIVASILSKKIAEGCDGLVLDVKYGNGAFMRETDDARNLARLLVDTARGAGKRAVALLTNMNQPLGRWIGNAVETREAIEVLRGQLDGDFATLSLELAAQMLLIGGVTNSLEVARFRARDSILSGAALEKFRECIVLQHGDPAVLDNYELLPRAGKSVVIRSSASGYLSGVATDEIGRIVMDWGGGRKRLEDEIDYGVGLEIHARLGDAINAGDPLVTAYYNDESKLKEMMRRVLNAYLIDDEPPSPEPLVKEIIQ